MREIRKRVTDINSRVLFREDASPYRVSCRLLNSPSTILSTQSDNKHENKPTIFVISSHAGSVDFSMYSTHVSTCSLLRCPAEIGAFG